LADTAVFEATLADFLFGPDEGLGVFIVGLDEGVDVLAKLGDGWERSPVQGFPSRIENQISTWLSQEARVGVKWNRTFG
jgi:hypothetical protein